MAVKIKDFNDEVLERVTRRTLAKRRMARILKSLSKVKRKKNRVERMDTEERHKKFLRREAKLEDIAPRKSSKRVKKIKAANQSNAKPDSLTKIGFSNIGLERKLTEMNNLLSVEFLEEGRAAARAVVRISNAKGLGTGFLVAPNIIMTNHHVIDSVQVGERSEFDIFAEENRIKPDFVEKTLYFSPSTFFYTNQELDVTFIAVEDEAECAECGWLPLIKETGKILIGHPVSVIQHPNGEDKKIAAHSSVLLDLEDSASKSSNTLL